MVNGPEVRVAGAMDQGRIRYQVGLGGDRSESLIIDVPYK